MKHDMSFSGKPVTFYFENLTGQPAFKITYIIYYWNFSDKLIGKFQGFMPGPIRVFFKPTLNVPKGTSKITAEVFNTWEYGQ